MISAYKAGAYYVCCQKDAMGTIHEAAQTYVENAQLKLKYPDAGHQRVG